MCVFGQPALSDVPMEEVCCRLVRCRRRTSSLTLPRSKLVRLQKQRFGFLLELGPVYSCSPFICNMFKHSCAEPLQP